MQDRTLTALSKEFGALKADRPSLDIQEIKKVAESRIAKYRLDIPAIVVSDLMGKGWELEYHFRREEPSGTFARKEDAELACESYNLQFSDNDLKAHRILLLDRVIDEIKSERMRLHGDKVRKVQAKQGKYLAHAAKNEIKNLLKGR